MFAILLLLIGLTTASEPFFLASWQIDTPFEILYNGSDASGHVLAVSNERIVFFESGEVRSIARDGSNLIRHTCGEFYMFFFFPKNF